MITTVCSPLIQQAWSTTVVNTTRVTAEVDRHDTRHVSYLYRSERKYNHRFEYWHQRRNGDYTFGQGGTFLPIHRSIRKRKKKKVRSRAVQDGKTSDAL